MNKVRFVLETLLRLEQVRNSSFYLKLLEEVTRQERVKVYQACMSNPNLAKHATKVQKTFFDGAKGGFEDNLGGNGAMSRR